MEIPVTRQDRSIRRARRADIADIENVSVEAYLQYRSEAARHIRRLR
jgi:hypothetical protein